MLGMLGVSGSAASTFAAFPREQLSPSAWVDFLHLVALGKPGVRVKVLEPGRRELARWCTRYGFGWNCDTEGFCCVAATKYLADRILEVDRRIEPHELDLGVLLGYPPCCCQAVAELGESRIDELAAAINSWEFRHRFRFIDPSGYTQGASLICHLPCSPSCEASLNIAIRAARFLRGRLGDPAFASWSRWAQLL